MQELFDFIGKHMTLSAEEKKAIIDLAIFRPYKRGHMLLKEGQYTDESYFVIKGCMRCYYLIDGEEKTTAFYTEFESFAPPCVVSQEPSTHYVSCTEDSIILVSNPDIEMLTFSKFPRFESLCRIMSEQLLAKSYASFDNFKTTSPEQRYMQLLETRPDLVQRVPQHQLASYIGITPESFSRIRKRLLIQAKT